MGRKSLYEKPLSTKETEESYSFIQIKGESPPGHTPVAFLSEGFRGRSLLLSQNPSTALFLSPVAAVLGRYSLPKAVTTFSPWTCYFPPEFRNSSCVGSATDFVLTHLSVTLKFRAKLSGLCSLRLAEVLRPISKILTSISPSDTHPWNCL